MTHQQSVSILGSTGSIGVNTLDVIASNSDRFSVFALSANSNAELLKTQCLAVRPKFAVIQDDEAARQLGDELREIGVTVLTGQEGLELIVTHDEVHCVMAAIVGGIGLGPTLAAARAGKKILLANKEALVMAGPLFMNAVAESGSLLLPIDSEHNAMFQCLPVNGKAKFENRVEDGFSKIVLTGSGGPFLKTDPAELGNVTPEQACAHPNWEMGKKISVDSATMVNKALELIEACFLYGVDEANIDILIHPQSIIHSLVYYRDGSALAQLGNPDMRTSIAYGLAWPERIDAGVRELDLVEIASLDFQQPDLARFPSLKLGRQAASTGGSAPIILNATNELAVEAFLGGSLRFDQIPDIIDAALQQLPVTGIDSLEELLEEDRKARQLGSELLKQRIQ